MSKSCESRDRWIDGPPPPVGWFNIPNSKLDQLADIISLLYSELYRLTTCKIMKNKEILSKKKIQLFILSNMMTV